MSRPDACRELHLLPDAPLAVAEAAYRAVARSAHPDAGGTTAAMVRASAAIESIRLSPAPAPPRPPAPPRACESRPPECWTVLRAGKFAGRRLEDVPRSYLGWMADEWSAAGMRREAAEVLHWLCR